MRLTPEGGMDVTVTRNKQTADGLDALIAGGTLTGKIGWTASDIHIDPETGEIQLVAKSALLNEFGYTKISPSGLTLIRVPARPFLRNTIRRQAYTWLNSMEAGAKKVLDGGVSFSTVLLKTTGEAIEDVRDTVRSRIEPPLAKLTLIKRNKYVRGAGIPTGTLPLYNTGHMMQTLTNEVTSR